MKSVDVFVAGGGPAGLAAGIAVRRKGFEVVVADALRPPIDKACGEGLMPNAVRAIDELGVSIPAEHSARFRGIRFTAPGIEVEADFPSESGLGVRRTTLHSLLAEQAERSGVQLLWDTTVRGIDDDVVSLSGAEAVRSRWIVGADGSSSRVRKWAGLDAAARFSRRFAFRRHYGRPPWTHCIEIWWGAGCQIYVTPVTADSVGIALMSRDSRLRLDDALPRFPELMGRLGGAEIITTERGAVSATRRLRRVQRGRFALIGDASGSVDAITGEGLSLAFQQAMSLADALATGDLADYESEHRRILRRPRFMGDFMLLLDRFPVLQRRALPALAANPRLFEQLLAMHVGELPIRHFAGASAALGWQILAG